MRFHIFGLANIPTRKENTYEPFTPLVWNMAKMLKDHGHHVTFYGCEGSDAPCDEMVNLVQEMPLIFKNGAPTQAWLNYRDADRWSIFCDRGRMELRQRYSSDDISLLSFGNYQKFVADESTLHCEFLCGYSGIFSYYKVFPSYNWMHFLYGQLNMESRPNWYDCVIPHYLDLSDFQVQEKKDDYLLFMGRLCTEKGPDVAVDIANRSGMRIVVAGVDHITNDIPEWLPKIPKAEYVGYVDPATRLSLMRGARALIHPCRYIEPFGMVAIEALACGTPVIASDWGGLPEIIEQGVTGYCCRDMKDFLEAVSNIDRIDPLACRLSVEKRNSLDSAYDSYMRYFSRLQRTLGEGWYGTSEKAWRGPEIESRLPNDKLLRGVEIGVDRGKLSSYLFRNLPMLYLSMVDTWSVFDKETSYAKSGDEITQRSQERRDQDRLLAMIGTEFASDRRTILCMTSENALKEIEDGSLDFAILDADHSYEGIKSDFAWMKKVKSGGLFCGHDYNNPGFPQWGVTKAVDELRDSGFEVVLGADFTWFVRVP